MVARIAILLVLVGGGIGTFLRMWYLFPETATADLTLLLMVVLAGSIATLVRFFITGMLMPLSGSTDFPFGTLAANLLGTALYAAIYITLVKNYFAGAFGHYAFYMVTLGLAGGLTTFSAFALDLVTLINKRKYGKLLGYLLLSFGISIGFTLALFNGFQVKGAESMAQEVMEINIIGCALMGVLGGIMVRYSDGGYGGTAVFVFFGTGILGGFTTFAQFVVELCYFLIDGKHELAAQFALQCFGGSVLAFMVCFYVIRMLLTPRRR